MEVAQAQIRALEHQLVDHGIDIRYEIIREKESNTRKDETITKQFMAHLMKVYGTLI